MNMDIHTNHLNVLLLYGRVTSAKRAKEFCDRLKNQLAPECEMKLSLWSLASLQLPDMARAAARIAEDAELMIVAVNGNNALPRTVMNCLNWCVREVRAREGALLAQLNGVLKTDEKTCPAYDCLRDIAFQCGLRFFSQVVELPDQEETSPWIVSPSPVAQGLYAEVNA